MAKKRRKPDHAAHKTRPSRPPRLDRGLLALVGLFLFFWAAFTAMDTFSPLKQRILGVDPVGYYVWFRSPAFDRDLQFENEYRALAIGPVAGDTLVNPDGPRTPTGHLQNAFSLGPALLWSPFLLAAHVVALLGAAPTDGFSQPYHSAVFIANAFYGLAGTLLVYGALRKRFGPAVGALAAAAAWAASPLLYYTFAQEAMSHAPSYFSIALFLFAWLRLRDRPGYAPWLAIGAALGLATLVRWQNVTFALVPTIDLLARDIQRDFPRLVACGLATVAVFLPQMIGWKILYGSFLTIPQGGGFMDWTHPRVLAVLFSADYGLVTWTPLTLLGVAGLFLWPRDDRLPYIALAAAFLVQFYVQAAAGNVGWAFGMRRMDNLVPLFAVGYALFMARFNLNPRHAAVLVGLFALWNYLTALQYGGFLNEFYVMRALRTFAAEHATSVQGLLQTGRVPGSPEPFNPHAFAAEHVFPKEGAPTLHQFTTDKRHVLAQIAKHLLGK